MYLIKVCLHLKTHSHQAKEEAQAQIFIDVWRYLFSLFFDLFRFRFRFCLVWIGP